MDNITKINLNGKEYIITDNEAQLVIQELLNRIAELEDKTAEAKEVSEFTKGSIFAGVMDETDKDNPITYELLASQLIKDSVNNKVFANTDKPITVRYDWLSAKKELPLKTFLLLVPATHKNLYSLSSPSQNFVGWDDEYTVVTINFPTGSMQYKVFRFANWLVRCQNEITYKF